MKSELSSKYRPRTIATVHTNYYESCAMTFIRFPLLCLCLFNIGLSNSVDTDNNIPLFNSYEIEKGGRPRDPFVAPDGSVWFCGQATNYLAKLNPATSVVKYYEVPEGSHPHNLIIDNKGMVWYAGNRNAHIGKLNPDTGDIIKFDMPDSITDPHTLVFDKDQNIWFTAQHSNAIGHLNVSTGKVRFVAMERKGSRPYGIKVDSQGNAWSVLVGTNRLARVDPNMTLTEYDIPRSDARPRRLEITRDDSIWYVDYAGGYLGRLNASTEKFNEWLMPSGEGSKPYATGLDSESVLWIFETGPYPNKLVSFDTKNELFTSESVIKEGGLVRHTYYDHKSKKLWFGVDVGFIMSAKVN